MPKSTLGPRSQTPVPAGVRALVEAGLGPRWVRAVMPAGTIIVRAKTKSILDLAGLLKAVQGRRVRVVDMNPWR